MRSVYIIGACAEGPVKIGCSANPKARLTGVQNGHPLRLSVLHTQSHPDAQRIETLTHRALKAHRLVGEWFTVDLDTARKAVEQAIVEYRDPVEQPEEEAEVETETVYAGCPAAGWRNDPAKFDAYIRSWKPLSAISDDA